MTNIVLHFGYPKTGSCALQQFLYMNRDDLRRQGVYYPKTGLHVHEHHALAFAIADNPYQQWTQTQADELFDSLRFEIDHCDCPTVLLSSELFAARLQQIATSEGFAKLFRGNDVRAVCFLRRQDQWLESCFKQSVWEGPGRMLENPETYINKHIWGADYYKFLCEWAEFLGKDHVVALVYEQAVRDGGCIKRFCAQLGVDANALAREGPELRTNISAGALSTEVMHLIVSNFDVPNALRLEIGNRIRELEKSVSRRPSQRIFSPAQCAKIEAALLQSNRALAREFIGQPLDGFWFRQSSSPL